MELQKIIDQLQNNLSLLRPVADESSRLVTSYEETIERLKIKQKTQEKGESE